MGADDKGTLERLKALRRKLVDGKIDLPNYEFFVAMSTISLPFIA